MPRNPTARHSPIAALLALALTVPAHAAGEIQITHSKALAGNVTPGDTAGYPVTLSTAGSFELAGNLAVPAGSVGIYITTQDVTVDLNGFRIDGSTTANYGVYGLSNSSTIRNGTVAHFMHHGIYLTGNYAIVEDMQVLGNGGIGIYLDDDAHVRSSTSSENGVDGVLCENACLVEQSTATSNDRNGIACGPSCHAEGNVLSFNGFYGIYLIEGFVLGNTISYNVNVGIFGGSSTASVYGNNTLTGNNSGGGGAQAQGVSSLHANHCYPGPCP